MMLPKLSSCSANPRGPELRPLPCADEQPFKKSAPPRSMTSPPISAQRGASSKGRCRSWERAGHRSSRLGRPAACGASRPLLQVAATVSFLITEQGAHPWLRELVFMPLRGPREPRPIAFRRTSRPKRRPVLRLEKVRVRGRSGPLDDHCLALSEGRGRFASGPLPVLDVGYGGR